MLLVSVTLLSHEEGDRYDKDMRMRRYATVIVASLVAAATMGVPSASSAGTPSTLVATLASSIESGTTLLRLTSTTTLTAARMPLLYIDPHLSTVWEQVGPDVIDAKVIARPQFDTTYTIEVPTAMSSGQVTAHRSATLTSTSSPTWAAQLLSELNYLPVSPHDPVTNHTLAGTLTPRAVAYSWRFPALPGAVAAQWSPTTTNVILRGAIMTFQNHMGLAATGTLDPTTGRLLEAAVAAKRSDTLPWDFVDVSESSPETLHLYENNRLVFTTLVNTGISVDPTSVGIYPVYLRYTSQTMSGFNPDGTRYSDPGIPWVSYFNGGDALHGFIRASYGFPQSLGCVEMPFASAQTVWPHTPIGTLVSVHAGR